MLHYNPRHVSSINIYLSSGGQIVLSQHMVSSLSVQPFTETDDTICCDNTICPPEDGHVNARNMSRILM
jgi:hypothetical protein